MHINVVYAYLMCLQQEMSLEHGNERTGFAGSVYGIEDRSYATRRQVLDICQRLCICWLYLRCAYAYLVFTACLFRGVYSS